MQRYYHFIFAILLTCALACSAQWQNDNDVGKRTPPPNEQQRVENKGGIQPVSKPAPVQKPSPVQKPTPVPSVQKPGQRPPEPESIVPQPQPRPPQPQPRPPQPPPQPRPPQPRPPQPLPQPIVSQIVIPQSVIVPMYNDRIEDELENLPRRGKTTPEGWTDDFNVALQTARKYNRPILILFTGSDWCHWCKKLNKEVLSRDKFEDFAERNLVLLYVDFPSNKRLPQALQDDNDALAQRYGVRGYPHTVVINTSGSILGRISGYSSNYVNSIREMMRNAGYSVRR